MPTNPNEAPKSEVAAPSRRVVLGVLAAVPALAACSSSAQSPDLFADAAGDDASEAGDDAAPSACPSSKNVGPSSQFSVGTFKRFGSVIVGRDDGGLYAFSSICTHAGCAVTLRSAGASYCPCHGATYDANGNVTRGPASIPLANLLTVVCEGSVFVDETQTVPEGTRVQG